MGFCIVDDIQFLTRVQYGSDTEPTLNQVNDWIEIIADEIKEELEQQNISIPEVGDKFYSVLKKYNAFGVAGIILAGNRAEIEENENVYWTYYKNFITSINEGKFNKAGEVVSENNVISGKTKDVMFNDWKDDFNY